MTIAQTATRLLSRIHYGPWMTGSQKLSDTLKRGLYGFWLGCMLTQRFLQKQGIIYEPGPDCPSMLPACQKCANELVEIPPELMNTRMINSNLEYACSQAKCLDCGNVQVIVG